LAVDWQILHQEASAIVAAAAEMVTLRVVGSGGIRLHCAPAAAAMDRAGRAAKDIDFIVPKADRKGMRHLLEGRGYVIDRDLLVAMEGTRYSFAHPVTTVELDVFVEKLEFNHIIEVRDRLNRHAETISLEDLLLAKLQIVNQTPNDLLDLTVLLSTHQVVPEGVGEDLDCSYVSDLLAKDWGFHHTVMRNLGRLDAAIGTSVDLGESANAQARSGATSLAARIEAKPKSFGWRARAKVGERVQWWEDVDERTATY
jgi:hypothetical protein